MGRENGSLTIRDRVKGFRRVRASKLADHPSNWRIHPPPQKAALRDLLKEIGIADALIVRETSQGLMLIDGHLRKSLDPNIEWPVLILDLDEVEADKMLLTLDPLALMAETDSEKSKLQAPGR
jgi:hypothetical protein